jgi:hypothetical protein
MVGRNATMPAIREACDAAGIDAEDVPREMGWEE